MKNKINILTGCGSKNKRSAAAEMVDHARAKWAERWGLLCPFSWGSWVPILHNVAGTEAFFHAKWHLDSSNRLATIHQRHRQDRTDRTD